jgi:hypothetical protein
MLEITEEKLINEKFRARDMALVVALDTLNKRLDGMNEFREALRDQNARYLSRSEYLTALEALTRSHDQLRIDVTAAGVRVEQTDKAASVDRASLDKRLDAVNEFRVQLRDQTSTFLIRNEYLSAHEALANDVKRLELSVVGSIGKHDHEKLEDRVKNNETQLANWNGRMWALGTVFLAMNIFVSWYLNGIHHL